MSPPAAHELWASWNVAPAAPLLALAWAYALGVERLWRQVGRGRALPGWRVAAFSGGLLAAGAALVSPLDALGHALLSAHMVQHLLLLVLAPPLLVLGAPALPLVWALPAGSRARLRRLAPPARLRRWPRAPLWGLVVWAVHLGTMWAWHLPVLYQAALTSPVVHLLEHATMFASAWLFWWAALRTPGPGVLYVSASAVVGGGLGALLTFSSTVWYPWYAATAPRWGVDPLADQQLAGLIMWVPAGAAYLIAGAALFAAWLVAVERRAGGREATAAAVAVPREGS